MKFFKKTMDLDVADFHAHILPGADHGSDSVETSLRQLALVKKFSVNRILANPHFYPNAHTVSAFVEECTSAAEKLKARLASDMPEVKLGAEVLICDGLERLPGLEKLCFSGTDYLMVELPFFNFCDEYIHTVSALNRRGFNVILAHVDRYPAAYIDEIIATGVKNLQINASSLNSIFPHKHLYRWLNEGLVTMIGSDLHDVSRSMYSKFVKGKNKISDFLPYIKECSDKIWNDISSL